MELNPYGSKKFRRIIADEWHGHPSPVLVNKQAMSRQRLTKDIEIPNHATQMRKCLTEIHE